ncbi:MAG: type I-U CRISPR-associated protein Cas5/Cas6 [Gammaproteobacteria bacterium]|nr:type I-U CRISPR-associated protein Cas5/Cas6 [Gammaproteobacteria bacterium]
MNKSLMVAVRIHDGRYHGEGDGFDGGSWPPSPARLFQGLVAGAARGGSIAVNDQQALAWLEDLPAPRIATPASRLGGTLSTFVPNNDLDAVGGDPGNVAKIRVGKAWRPRLFDPSIPILYVWEFETQEAQARRLCETATQLYQLGRGVDMAAATGEVLGNDESEARLVAYAGSIWRPSSSGTIAVPGPGSLTSLLVRQQGRRQRLSSNDGQTRFTQPPKAWFRYVGYEAPPRWLHFEVRDESRFAPRPLHSAAAFVVGIRNQAARKLQDALPRKSPEVERLVVGRNADRHDLVLRPRILPIPSIGTQHTDPSIRRVTVEVPRECPISSRDLEWAFAGLAPMDPATGETWSGKLVSTGDETMADRFRRPSRLFRSVTAVALSRARRRPAGDAHQRREDEARATAAVVQALRDAGVRTKPSSIAVQREPLQRRGARADAFANGSRFSPMAMWHVEIEFPSEVSGPLAIGDGRFTGLGLMEPVVHDHCDLFALRFDTGVRVSRPDGAVLLLALRRALMALARDDRGRVSRLFSGHEDDGSPDRSPHDGHIFVAADTGQHGQRDWIERLLVVAPWRGDHAKAPQGPARQMFDRTVRALHDLRAGSVGRFRLAALPLSDGDPVVGPAATWESVTPYLATRHAKSKSRARAAIAKDLYAECARRGIPAPERLALSEISVGPKGGSPKASVTLHFATAFRGPLLLGRDSHSGGGLFHAVPPSEARSDPSREQAWKELRATMNEIGREATRRGLTDAELERLLADES